MLEIRKLSLPLLALPSACDPPSVDPLSGESARSADGRIGAR